MKRKSRSKKQIGHNIKAKSGNPISHKKRSLQSSSAMRVMRKKDSKSKLCNESGGPRNLLKEADDGSGKEDDEKRKEEFDSSDEERYLEIKDSVLGAKDRLL